MCQSLSLERCQKGVGSGSVIHSGSRSSMGGSGPAGRRNDGSDDLGVHLVAVAGGGGPDEAAGFGLVEPPASMGLAVVAAGAERSTVGRRWCFLRGCRPGWCGRTGTAGRDGYRSGIDMFGPGRARGRPDPPADGTGWCRSRAARRLQGRSTAAARCRARRSAGRLRR